MNDDVEEILGRLAPHGPEKALRTDVLAAIDREFGRQRGARRVRWAALAAAALLSASVGLNLWTDQKIDARLAQIVGPAPLDRQALELANDIASVTDAETGRWFYQRITSQRRSPRSYQKSLRQYQRILERMTQMSDAERDREGL